MRKKFVYCPRCATPLAPRASVDDRLRPTCPSCDFVQFHDPKVAVIAFLTRGLVRVEEVLLVQRGVEPEIDKWALPGGYMDAGELPEEALSRELREEVRLAAEIGRLMEILPLLRGDFVDGMVLVYHAIPIDPAIAPTSGDDVRDARWFTAKDLPAEADIAFESTRSLLKKWAAKIAH